MSLRAGELTLAAESTAWATQLRGMLPTLMTRIRTELGPDVVTRIRVHGPTGPTWRSGPRRVAGRGPRDTAEPSADGPPVAGPGVRTGRRCVAVAARSR